MTQLSACICTFRRPEQLGALLQSLASQPLPEGATLQIVVVDNDPDQAGAPVAEAFARERPDIALDYSHCAERNISLARNQSVRRATGEFLFFIDDDEVALENWITELHATLMRTGADVVSGQLVPEFKVEPPSWMVDSRYFHRDVPPTGEPMKRSGVGNCVIRRQALQPYIRDGQGPFDPQFGLTGGEDSLLLRQMRADGRYITGCRTAVVREAIPEQRTTWQWMRARARRTGAIYVIVERRVRRWKRLTVCGLCVLAGGKWLLSALIAQLPARESFRRRWALRRESYLGHLHGAAGHVEQAY